MESIQTLSNQYALGHSQPELERLVHQERFLGELTEIMLLKAGLVPGMRVLDVGCGAGDVSFLGAKLVGPEGAVIGVDRAPEAIAFAHQRAQSAGLPGAQTMAMLRYENGPDSAIYAWIEQLTRTLLPLMQQTGVATAEEVQVDTLAGRMRQEAVEKGCTLITPPLVAAW
ncbi:hypothetical protein RY27_27950, partial [Litorilinea aerophila]